MGCSYLIDDDKIYYYIRDALNIPDASILEDLLEIQYKIYEIDIIICIIT